MKTLNAEILDPPATIVVNVSLEITREEAESLRQFMQLDITIPSAANKLNSKIKEKTVGDFMSIFWKVLDK